MVFIFFFKKKMFLRHRFLCYPGNQTVQDLGGGLIINCFIIDLKIMFTDQHQEVVLERLVTGINSLISPDIYITKYLETARPVVPGDEPLLQNKERNSECEQSLAVHLSARHI